MSRVRTSGLAWLHVTRERMDMPRQRLPLLVGVICALGLAACHHGAPPAPVPVPTADRIYYDNGGGIQDSVRMVIRTQQAFQSVWQQATSQQSSPPPVPTIDFSHDMVLVVAAGRMTPEDQIHVDSVAVRQVPDAQGHMQKGLRVVVDVIRGCVQFKSAAYPLEIVRVRRYNGPVQFVERRSRAQGCTGGSGSAQPS